jgi:hypothetical protein
MTPAAIQPIVPIVIRMRTLLILLAMDKGYPYRLRLLVEQDEKNQANQGQCGY